MPWRADSAKLKEQSHRIGSRTIKTKSHLFGATTFAALLVACGLESPPLEEIGIGAVTLSWTAPTLNTDGSPLSDLAGYNIYYGTEPGNYSVTIHVDNPGLTTYVVEYLTPNDYYFVVTAINSNGIESRYSGEASTPVF